MDENIKWLSNWLESQYKISWQGQHIVTMGTLDNPGWTFQLKVDETTMQNQPFSEIIINRTERNWIDCFVRDGWFLGAGGLYNLPEIVQIFRNWVVEGKSRGLDSAELQRLANQTGDLFWLTEWFAWQCDGDWEHCYGISIDNNDGQSWSFEIRFGDTELENQPFETIGIRRSEKDWVSCSMSYRDIIEGNSGLLNLPEMLKIFRNWAEPIWQKAILENS